MTARSQTPRQVELVVKLGGRVMSEGAQFDAALEAIRSAARQTTLVVVPGGGVFANAVREADRRLGLSDDTAHWLAVRALDSSARLVSERLTGSVVVEEPEAIAQAVTAGRIPVLAPARWCEESDPMPHTWDVTSDSIAAWVARSLGASRVVLIKARGVSLYRSEDAAGRGMELVDPWFERTVGGKVSWTIAGIDQLSNAFSQHFRQGGPPLKPQDVHSAL